MLPFALLLNATMVPSGDQLGVTSHPFTLVSGLTTAAKAAGGVSRRIRKKTALRAANVTRLAAAQAIHGLRDLSRYPAGADAVFASRSSSRATFRSAIV